MGYIRQLPSGLWANTIHTPIGRITETHELRGAVVAWEQGIKADINRGEFIDPRLAKHTVGEVWEKYAPARRVEMASRKRDESHWKVWVAPRWAKEPIGGILKPDVQMWVNQMEEDDVGGWTIIAALNVLKAALEFAVDAGWIRANPARRVRPPVAPAHVDRVIDGDEEALILDRLDELFPERRDARLFVETMLETGGRWEEIAAVRREAVNLRTALIALGPVMERDGTRARVPEGRPVAEPSGVPGRAARRRAAGPAAADRAGDRSGRAGVHRAEGRVAAVPDVAAAGVEPGAAGAEAAGGRSAADAARLPPHVRDAAGRRRDPGARPDGADGPQGRTVRPAVHALRGPPVRRCAGGVEARPRRLAGRIAR
jgi:hypothetical protein